MTQRDRVLRLLKQRGSLGLTQADVLPPVVADDGAPIGRLAARVQDLRDRGYAIVTVGVRDGYAVYVLGAYSGVPTARREDHLVPATETDPQPAPEPEPPTPLHEVEPQPRSAVLGWEDEAA